MKSGITNNHGVLDRVPSVAVRKVSTYVFATLPLKTFNTVTHPHYILSNIRFCCPHIPPPFQMTQPPPPPLTPTPELAESKSRDKEYPPLRDDASSVYSQPHPGEAGYIEPEEKDSKYITEHIVGDDSEDSDIVVVKTKSRHPDEPTEEDLTTLRRVPGVLPFVCYTIAFIEFCERLSFCGILTVFVNYIQQPLPEGSMTGAGGSDDQSGALGLGQKTATALVSCRYLYYVSHSQIR